MTDWLGRAGPVIPLSRGWHAASAATAAGTSDAFISASRLESLKVKGILAPSLVQEGLPASAQSRFRSEPRGRGEQRLPVDTIVAQVGRSCGTESERVTVSSTERRGERSGRLWSQADGGQAPPLTVGYRCVAA